MSDILPFKPVAIAPTFNNDRTLEDVLRRIDAIGLPVIAINDGCSDGSAAILERWQRGSDTHHVVTHAENRGKAAALRSGFKQATDLGFTHAGTIDTDGQLDPAEI